MSKSICMESSITSENHWVIHIYAVLNLFFIRFVFMVFLSLPQFICHYTTRLYRNAIFVHITAGRWQMNPNYDTIKTVKQEIIVYMML